MNAKLFNKFKNIKLIIILKNQCYFYKNFKIENEKNVNKSLKT